MSNKNGKNVVWKDNDSNLISNDNIFSKLYHYNLDLYIKDVEKLGLEKTWNDICEYFIRKGESNEFLCVKNFSELYEIGLAIVDKLKKKKKGQYYTPDDVAVVMSKWLEQCEGDNICDVACGTGKLILTYLDSIGRDKALKLLQEGKIYLYDYDKVALKVCKTSLLIKYGMDLEDKINDIYCDFLDHRIILPNNCKIIANPPYAAMKEFSNNWDLTDVIIDTHEWYSAFMEKIFHQSNSAVIITPFSFVSGNKFYSLRKKMCNLGNGFIVSFDNVPGNIFCGKKRGIFNTNTSNSVRAAITVFNRSDKQKGFRVSPLIRFKNEERKLLLKNSVLKSTISKEYQIVDDQEKEFRKISHDLKMVYDNWVSKSAYSLKDFLSKEKNKNIIDVPNTCRYYTTGSSKKLNRGGSILLSIEGVEEYYFLYCFLNSSFAYWWWRIYDGGITYPVSLLKKLPVPFNLLNEQDKEEFQCFARKMMDKESCYLSTKVNAGVVQENIKFPKKYRDFINYKILCLLGIDEKSSIFDSIHANKFFIEEGDCDDF